MTAVRCSFVLQTPKMTSRMSKGPCRNKYTKCSELESTEQKFTRCHVKCISSQLHMFVTCEMTTANG
jgi:hypothetical protein